MHVSGHRARPRARIRDDDGRQIDRGPVGQHRGRTTIANLAFEVEPVCVDAWECQVQIAWLDRSRVVGDAREHGTSVLRTLGTDHQRDVVDRDRVRLVAPVIESGMQLTFRRHGIPPTRVRVDATA